MKYLFVIYTDGRKRYQEYLKNFYDTELFTRVCTEQNIEVAFWGQHHRREYRELPKKTQEMMKWCSENKEYDYLVKCDDNTFMREDLKDEFVYENIFTDSKEEYQGIVERTFSYDEFYIDWYKNKDLGELDQDLSEICTGKFYDGKCYTVSKELSSFIGEQEGLAKMFAERLSAMEDVMVSFMYREMYK
jgi:hypothetical protein|tara:strand:+ start:777 stop:1343 length:567 start_codon:yes stop_codon:yes gene_type:complete